jgi:hypothetical protein
MLASTSSRPENPFDREMRMLQERQALKMREPPVKENLLDRFIKERVLGKNVLTRRDITTNRIIMKNIIKDYMANDFN